MLVCIRTRGGVIPDNKQDNPRKQWREKNDRSTQPKGSLCLFFAIRYAMCMRKRYTNPNAAVIPKIISNTSHTSGSITTRYVCKIEPIIFVCRISTRILPCICGRDLSELHHSYNKHNCPYIRTLSM